MSQKLEKWMEDIFPGRDQIYEKYSDLPPRELGIVAASVLDIALAELLSRRLIDHKKEIESFVGLDGDGRAPCGTFSARIQLAILTGVIMPDDGEILRCIQKIRNILAHRVNVDFLTKDVVTQLRKLHARLINKYVVFNASGTLCVSPTPLKEVGDSLGKIAEAGEGLLLATFCVYQAYFHSLHGQIKRIERLEVRREVAG
ncbi:hypothetical protein PWG15_12735 [Ensifer adhaerens]|uniref:hypothetical protein n=1 Tax=Ensifer adhaerens TaxID=106592 RepID=UPI0023A93FFA|nr:hypothetical protein [Ensifer adhaerens]WDZ75482.1 hypothetical protein PWG15_12735 [Ensifer adhaerens]